MNGDLPTHTPPPPPYTHSNLTTFIAGKSLLHETRIPQAEEPVFTRAQATQNGAEYWARPVWYLRLMDPGSFLVKGWLCFVAF